MNNSPIKVSQGYEVLRPKADQAYPVPCNEWDNLRMQIETLTTEPWLFQSAASLLLGASIATAISICTGAVTPSSTTPNATVIAWAVTAVSGLSGIVTMIFANKERKVHRNRATMVATQMKFIEERFERLS